MPNGRKDGQYDGNGTHTRPVTVVFYEVLQSGVRVLHGADGAGQGRRSAVQTSLQGLHRSPQFLQIGKAGVQFFPGGGAVHVGGEIQRLQLSGGTPDGPTKGIHRPQRIGGRGGLGRRRGQLGGFRPGDGPVDKAREVPVGVVVSDVFLHGGLEVDVLPAGHFIGVCHGHLAALGPAGHGLVQIQKIQMPLHRGPAQIALGGHQSRLLLGALGELSAFREDFPQRFQLAGHVEGGEAAPVDIGAHQRPQLGELIRIPADFTGDGGLAQLPGGHHPAVSADDAPCVLAVGRDHDVLQKAVLLHGAHGGKELIVLRHGEAVHGVIHQRRHRQLAGQLTVDGAGVFRCLLQGGEDRGAFFTCHGSALHSCQHFVAQGGVIAGGGAAGGEEAQGLEGQRGLLHVDILADVRLEGQTRQHGGEVGDHFPVKAGAGLHGGHEDAQGPDVRVGDLADGLDGLQHDVVALDGVFIHLDGDEDILNGYQHVDIEQALQRGGAVEKHEIVSIGDLGQEAAQGGIPAKGHLLHGGQRRSQQAAAPDQVEVFGSGVADGVRQRGGLGHDDVRQRGGGNLRQGQVAGGVALSIHVHDQNLFALECKSEVNILWKENCRRYPSKCVLEAYNR